MVQTTRAKTPGQSLQVLKAFNIFEQHLLAFPKFELEFMIQNFGIAMGDYSLLERPSSNKRINT